MATLFISDLHLDPARPETIGLFLDFLTRSARQAEACYILGDLFEVWIGDDDDAEIGRTIGQALRTVADAGIPLFFLHGNRDFLIGERFATTAGLQLLPELQVIDLYGKPVLLLHGDTLCTDDVDYQTFRAQVRNPDWQTQLLTLPFAQRRKLAGQLRETSRQAGQLKATDITDVNLLAVEQALQEHGVQSMIHGHTHRPAIHDWPLAGRSARRAVLGDWSTTGSVLRCDQSGWRLETVTPATA